MAQQYVYAKRNWFIYLSPSRSCLCFNLNLNTLVILLFCHTTSPLREWWTTYGGRVGEQYATVHSDVQFVRWVSRIHKCPNMVASHLQNLCLSRRGTTTGYWRGLSRLMTPCHLSCLLGGLKRLITSWNFLPHIKFLAERVCDKAGMHFRIGRQTT